MSWHRPSPYYFARMRRNNTEQIRMTCRYRTITAELFFRLTCAVCLSTLVIFGSIQPITVEATSLAPVSWNSSNPIFKSSVKDHVIEVKLFDDVDFVCPYIEFPENGSSSSSSEWHEYFTIYMVSQREYDECSIHPRGTSTPILNCSSPQQRKRFTILFEPFQSIPNAQEYHSGVSYYYVTTSTGTWDGLDNLQHGACVEHNMKLTIRVCCRLPGRQDRPTSVNRSNSISSKLVANGNADVITDRVTVRDVDRRFQSTPRLEMEMKSRTTYFPTNRLKLTSTEAENDEIDGQLMDGEKENRNVFFQGIHNRNTEIQVNFDDRTPSKPDRLFLVSDHSGTTGHHRSPTSVEIFLTILLLLIPTNFISYVL